MSRSALNSASPSPMLTTFFQLPFPYILLMTRLIAVSFFLIDWPMRTTSASKEAAKHALPQFNFDFGHGSSKQCSTNPEHKSERNLAHPPRGLTESRGIRIPVCHLYKRLLKASQLQQNKKGAKLDKALKLSARSTSCSTRPGPEAWRHSPPPVAQYSLLFLAL